MNTTSSEIITRALGISDLVNATNISYNDKVRSLNEGYRDIYNLLLDSNDDYYVTEIVIPIIPAYLNQTSIGQYYEYNVPMPVDVERLRYVDYTGNNNWAPMSKYPMNIKDMNPGQPYYRWRNGNLNIIGGGYGTALASIRVGYYPTRKALSLPGNSTNIGSTLPLATRTALVSPDFTGTYVSGGNINTANGSVGRVVYYNGTSIVSEDEDLGTITTLYTGVGISQVKYYQGYVFFLQAGSLYRFYSDLTAVGVPTLIVTPGVAPTEFGILIPTVANTPVNYNPPYLLWTSDMSTFSSIYTVAGALVNTVAQGYRSFFTCQGFFFAVSPAGVLYKFTGTTFTIASGIVIPYTTTILDAWSDGVAIYFTENFTSKLVKGRLNTALTAFDTTVVLADDIYIQNFWNVDNGMATYYRTDLVWVSISLEEDTIITYPNNAVYELISYQCAIDFIAKQKGDATQVQARYASTYNSLKDSLIRDDYQVERIQSDGFYSNNGWWV